MAPVPEVGNIFGTGSNMASWPGSNYFMYKAGY
jgi:hypothetical protein